MPPSCPRSPTRTRTWSWRNWTSKISTRFQALFKIFRILTNRQEKKSKQSLMFPCKAKQIQGSLLVSWERIETSSKIAKCFFVCLLKNAGLDCLINNAGYAPKSTRYNMVTTDQMIKTLTINSIAPLMLSKALIPLLKREVQPGNKSSLIVNISSILGSIHQNHPSFGSGSGGLYPYRSSKAALNMITRSLCIDLVKADLCSKLAIYDAKSS